MSSRCSHTTCLHFACPILTRGMERIIDGGCDGWGGRCCDGWLEYSAVERTGVVPHRRGRGGGVGSVVYPHCLSSSAAAVRTGVGAVRRRLVVSCCLIATPWRGRAPPCLTVCTLRHGTPSQQLRRRPTPRPSISINTATPQIVVCDVSEIRSLHNLKEIT